MLGILDDDQRSTIAEAALVSLLAGPVPRSKPEADAEPAAKDCDKKFEFHVDLGEIISNQQDTPKSKPAEKYQKQVDAYYYRHTLIAARM